MEHDIAVDSFLILLGICVACALTVTLACMPLLPIAVGAGASGVILATLGSVAVGAGAEVMILSGGIGLNKDLARNDLNNAIINLDKSKDFLILAAAVSTVLQRKKEAEVAR